MGGAGIAVEEVFARMAAAATSLDLKRALRTAVQDVGFQYFQLQRFKLGHLIDVPWLELPPVPAPVMPKAAAAGSDPIAVRALDAATPFWWHDMACRSDVSETEAAWIRAFEAAGVGPAVTLPVHGPGGACDVLHIWAPASAPSSPARLSALSALAYVCCARLRQLDGASGKPRGVTLSARELEVLRWCKDGKSYSEIGTIMGISGKTVEFHIANVMRKLGVNQKITAIVVAIRQGLISI